MSSRGDSVADEWRRLVDESIRVRQALRERLAEPLERCTDVLTSALAAGNKILIVGNGGSAADALHIAGEFVGRFRLERAALPALALSDNVSSLTAIGNDYAYERAFARQVEAFGKPGDVLLAISTSGASASVVKAIEVAKPRQVKTISLTGPGPNAVGTLTDIPVYFDAPTTASIQEAYMLFAHALCRVVEDRLAENSLPSIGR
jgi:D-sedoheptulose 7-phosphate isomerase